MSQDDDRRLGRQDPLPQVLDHIGPVDVRELVIDDDEPKVMVLGDLHARAGRLDHQEPQSLPSACDLGEENSPLVVSADVEHRRTPPRSGRWMRSTILLRRRSP